MIYLLRSYNRTRGERVVINRSVLLDTELIVRESSDNKFIYYDELF